MKKGLSLLLVVCLVMSIAAVPALAKEADIPFTDVTKDNWFYNDVKGAYYTGLINGKTETAFKPDDNMTYAEAIKLAACMHQYVEDGEVTLQNGDPWYQTYVNYAKDNNIIEKDYTFNDNASRSGYMEIFANCLPDENLPIINAIEDGSIPDVKATAAYAPAVYKLYRAGILTGVDEEHNCNPYDNIKRSEVAAILTRMMDKDARKEFSMGDPDNAPTQKPAGTPEPTAKPEATAKPLAVSALPEEALVSLEEPVTLKAIVSGGKAPYTYDWTVYSRSAVSGSGSGAAKQKYGDYVALDSEIATKDGFPEVEFKDNTVTFTVLDKDFFKTFSKMKCTVTDADGKKEEVSFTLKFTGTGDYNELLTDTFLMYVEDVYWITDRGLVVTGRITNGTVKVGDNLKLMKRDGTVETVKVAGVEMFKKMLDKAEKGDNVGLLLNGLGDDPEVAKAKVKRGEALTSYPDGLAAVRCFDITFKVYTKAEGGLSAHHAGDGTYKPQLYIGTSDVTGALMNWVIDEDENWTKAEFVPGETYHYVEVKLVTDTVVYPGQTGTVRENGVTIGEFTVDFVDDDDYYWFPEDEDEDMPELAAR